MDEDQKPTAPLSLADLEQIAKVSSGGMADWKEFLLYWRDDHPTFSKQEIINEIKERLRDRLGEIDIQAFNETHKWNGILSMIQAKMAEENAALAPTVPAELEGLKEQKAAAEAAEAAEEETKSGQKIKAQVQRALEFQAQKDLQDKAAEVQAAQNPQEAAISEQSRSAASTTTVGKRGVPISAPSPRKDEETQHSTGEQPKTGFRKQTEETLERLGKSAEARGTRATENLPKHLKEQWGAAWDMAWGKKPSSGESNLSTEGTESGEKITSSASAQNSDLYKTRTSQQGQAGYFAERNQAKAEELSAAAEAQSAGGRISQALTGAKNTIGRIAGSSEAQNASASASSAAQIYASKGLDYAYQAGSQVTSSFLNGAVRLFGSQPTNMVPAYGGAGGPGGGFAPGGGGGYAPPSGGTGGFGNTPRSLPGGLGNLGGLANGLGRARDLLSLFGGASTASVSAWIIVGVVIVMLIVLIIFTYIMVQFIGTPVIPDPNGQAREAVFSVQKSADPESLPDYKDAVGATINYKMTITAGKSPLTITSIEDETTRYKDSKEAPVKKTTIQNPPAPLNPGQTFETTYPLQISGADFHDSILVNVVTVVGKDGTGKEETQKASVAILINNPKLQQPYGFPSIGYISSLDWASGKQEHFSCFFVFGGECIYGGIDIANRGRTEVFSTLDGQLLDTHWDTNVGGVIYVQSCLPGQTPPNCKGPYVAEFEHLEKAAADFWSSRKGKFVARHQSLGFTYADQPKLDATRCSNPNDCHPEHVHYQLTLNGANVAFCDGDPKNVRGGHCFSNTWGSCLQGKIEKSPPPKLGQTIGPKLVAPACDDRSENLIKN